MSVRIPLTKKTFEETVKNHEMHIFNSSPDNVYRNVRFRQPNTNDKYFDLTTWPGFLCFSGDMGCFVFNRLDDMFNFFDYDGEFPNFGYWAEKLEGVDRISTGNNVFCNGYRVHTSQAFWVASEDYFKMFFEESGDGVSKFNYFKEEYDFDAENPFACHEAIVDYFEQYDGFCDFWEYTTTEYTYRYEWACWAIRWGVQKYKKYIHEISKHGTVSCGNGRKECQTKN